VGGGGSENLVKQEKVEKTKEDQKKVTLKKGNGQRLSPQRMRERKIIRLAGKESSK